ncbi:MAG: OadG-related small transporter subunit [Acutalibacteraceae bacterium]|jgi:Na+-transporting methylmalonyl-CoA/oxaloacetate decarboxylase gamma subunit
MLRFAKNLFQSALGMVNEETLMQALKLMLYGMVGIFIVMVLIYAVIVVLNRVTAREAKKEKEEAKKN